MSGRLMGWRECVRKCWRSSIELIGSYRKGKVGKVVEEDGGDSGEGVGRMGGWSCVGGRRGGRGWRNADDD